MRQRVRNLVRWIGGHELITLLAMSVVMIGIWGFVQLAGEVVEGDTQAFDERMLQELRRPDNPHQPIGPGWMHEVGRDFTALGGYAVLVLVTFAVLGYLWLDRKYAALVFVMAAVFGGFALAMGLKAAFGRPRPDVVPHLSLVHTSSFPSGHAMMSAVAYLTLGTLLGRFVTSLALKFYFLSLAVVLTMCVGLSRVYMGVHYPTDVLAGWAAGMAWATFCWLAATWLQRRGTIEKEHEHSAPPLSGT